MLHELFISEDFKKYQLKLMEELVEVIVGSYINTQPEHAKGAIDIAKRVIAFPSKLNKDDKAINSVQKEVMERFKRSFLIV